MLSEQSSRYLINNILESKGWVLNPHDPQRNVLFEGSELPDVHSSKLEGQRPDYSLFDDRHNLIGVIEAKRPDKNLDEALEQSIVYAQKLGAHFALAANGVFCKTFHLASHRPLSINGDEVKELLRYRDALRFISEGTHEFYTIPPEVKKSREELLGIFDHIDTYLWDDNIQAGLPRFLEFANLLFLKLLGERAEQSFWHDLKTQRNKVDYLNKMIIPQLVTQYEAQGVFVESQIRKERTLQRIFDALDSLHLTTTDSDVKGDAFEYFLKNSTSIKNDLGQYFTPRHIVKTMVHLVSPTIHDTIYDPFCGTGGFLTESFDYIRETSSLTPPQLTHLKRHVLFGRDASVSARIAKMNAILHGDGHSGIEHVSDTLEHPVDKQFSIGLTNIPFSQNKKNNEYSRLYEGGLARNNGDAICILHLFKALRPGGKMAAIVPEGFLFRKELASVRRFLTDHADLKLIVSLPQGVFLPYTSVKTDILYFENVHTPSSLSKFWYFDVKNDGFTLNHHRRKLEGPHDLDVLESAYLEEEASLVPLGFTSVPFDQVRNNQENWIGKQYIAFKERWSDTQAHRISSLGDLEKKGWITVKKGTPITRSHAIEGTIPVIAGGQSSPYTHNQSNHKGNVITISASGSAGHVMYHAQPIWASDCTVLQSQNDAVLSTQYLYWMLKGKQDVLYSLQRGTGQPHVYGSDLRFVQIPLPPLSVQQEIVEELEGYTKIIQGAQQVVKHWKPKIAIDPTWETLPLEDVTCFIGRGKTPCYGRGPIRVIKSGQLKGFYEFDWSKAFYLQQDIDPKERLLRPYDILINTTGVGTAGRVGVFTPREELYTVDSHITILRAKTNILPQYVLYFLASYYGFKGLEAMARGSSGQIELSLGLLRKILIKVPPLEIQRGIVLFLEKEYQDIEYSKKTAIYFENKIQERLNDLWHTGFSSS